MDIPVGLNALQQTLPSHRRLFLGRGDIVNVYKLHVLRILPLIQTPLLSLPSLSRLAGIVILYISRTANQGKDLLCAGQARMVEIFSMKTDNHYKTGS